MIRPNSRSFSSVIALLPSLLWANILPANEQALHLNWNDPHIAITDDFYTYANGNWQKNNPIPKEYGSWSAFSILQEKNLHRLHDLVKQAATTHAQPGSIEQKVGDFYASGMDTTQINKLGVTPLADEFQRIDALQGLQDLPKALAHLHLIGVNALFSFGSMQDFKDSTQDIAAIAQGGLSLPNRDYYLQDRFAAIREAFVQHVYRSLKLLGEPEATALRDAQTVMRLETALAKASLSPIEQRDPLAIYHMIPLHQLDSSVFSWPTYLQALGLVTLPAQVNLSMPRFIQALQQDLNTTPFADWKVYLRWHLLSDYASFLSTPFVQEQFKMRAVLSGTQRILPRWKQVLAAENQSLGFALGELYTQHYFSPKAKENVTRMVNNIRHVLEDDLKTLSWMEPVTRRAALKKLAMMDVRVGYPKKNIDYTSLVINRGPYALNILRANVFWAHHELAKIGKPVDRDEWEMTPQTINAYYDPSMNSINLPSGILQPPFYDEQAPDAVNYGGIGFVIGHEITHGFDDQGAQFDGHGNLHDWWTPHDLATFKAATRCVSEQFSGFRVNGTLPVQGPLVVGEATADLGGVTLAYRALQATPGWKTAKTLLGLTPAQQFFLSAAHVWATNIRPEQAAQYISADPHPPAQFRINGTFANMPAFQEAFHLKPDSLMVKKERCHIW